MYGDLATRAGYTFREIDELDLWDYRVLTNHWAQHPPLRDLLDLFMQAWGIKVEPRTASGGTTPAVEIEQPPEFED